MDRLEIEAALETFSVIVDTREQATPAAKQRIEAIGVPVTRATLNYGDYCGQMLLPNGGTIYNDSGRISPAFAIERKMSLDELAGCLTRDRARFQREFERARDSGGKMVLLVENGSWEAIINHRYRSKLHPNAFLASLTAWTVRFGICPIFCKTATSGTIIKELLYRDMKERLERGEYG